MCIAVVEREIENNEDKNVCFFLAKCEYDCMNLVLSCIMEVAVPSICRIFFHFRWFHAFLGQMFNEGRVPLREPESTGVVGEFVRPTVNVCFSFLF